MPKIHAQCNDINISLVKTNATCVSNGMIKVNVSGADIGNINQSNMQFKVDGSVTRSWAHYDNNTITNLPAGTFTISLQAFCNSINDWVVVSNTATTTLTTSYTEMDAYFGIIRKTLNCKPTGSVPIQIKPYTGSSPFTITITNYPASYTGTKTFTFSRVNASYSTSKVIEDLPAGDYTFIVTDDCSYTKTLNTTVGTMTQDFVNDMFYNYVYPAKSIHNNCNVISISKYQSTRPPDETHYFASYPQRYFEVGFKINNTDPIIWIPSDSLQSSFFEFTLPQSIKTFKNNGDKLTPYLRVKGTSCINQLRDIIIYPYNISMNIRYEDIGCNDATVRFYPYNAYYSVFCYPYKWRIIKNDGSGTVLHDWSENIYDRTPQIVENLPYGGKIEFIDHEGYTWSSVLITSAPSPTYTSSNTPCMSYGVTGNTIHSYFSLFLSSVDSIPAGTRIRYVPGSGPSTPVHTDITLTNKTYRFYPFSSDYTKSAYHYIPAGIYQFEVTLPGVGCTTKNCYVYHTAPVIITPFTYTTKETCGGLNIIPTAGQLGHQSYNGTISSITPYYYISSIDPWSSIERGPVSLGDTLFFPTSAKYIFGVTYYPTGSCLGDADTIDYVKTPFALNPNVTAAYVCEGSGGQGFIRVAGMGGSGNYFYELYDGGTKMTTSSTGVFNYGTAGSTYTIKLIDTDPECASSYDQEVQLLDLTTVHILYSSSPTNRYCLDEDSIRLKCISLGETNYEWTGPGITTDKKNMQNPMVAINDLGTGTYTYSIKVTPEGCGTEMNQTITITIEDCSGAQDDYLTLFVNTTDSVDVLANDKFPSICAASVTPVVSIGPTQGTYTLNSNNKIIYTPHTNFTGRDSLTYQTTCSGTTTSAKIYFTVIEYPDNISYETCYSTPEGFTWDIKQDFASPASTNHTFVIPLVGDFDGDSIPDILTVSNNKNRLNIYWGKDRATTNVPTSITLTTAVDIAWQNGEAIAPYAIFKTKINGVDKSIVIVNDKHNLYAYDLNGPSNQANQHLWKTELANNYSLARSTVGIADLNNDGIPEVYVRNKIFNAHTGKLLVQGNAADKTGNTGFCYSVRGNEYFTIAADVIGDSQLELIAGSEVYSVDITNTENSSGNKLTRVAKLNATFDDGVTAINDGKTTVVDINQDGKLDIVFVASSTKVRKIIAWNAESEELLFETPNFTYDNTGIPLIGNIDKTPDLEVSLIVNYLLLSYKPNPATKKFDLAYQLSIADRSGATGITLFDFNQDSVAEIVYRDESILRIMQAVPPTSGTVGTFRNLKTYSGGSGTWYEYPIVADVDNDGSGEIVVISGNGYVETGSLRIYRSGNQYSWAPARRVWNQYAYNAVNVNNDLTIPKYQVNPATFFPGEDGILGTADDVQPYNGFLLQQTVLNKDGIPLWLVPDVYPHPSLVSSDITGDSVSITVGIINQGDAVIGSPVYVSLYKESISSGTKIATDSANIRILPGDTGYVAVRIADITPYLPILNMVIRVNDNGTKFTYQSECDNSNNVITIMNPALHLMMKKDATLLLSPPVSDNGTYSNPVSILHSENIKYDITSVNVNESSGKVIIKDTLPAYLRYVPNSATYVADLQTSLTTGVPRQDILTWTMTGVSSMESRIVSYEASPEEGSCASQPMFINRAWITTSDTLHTATGNNTYHQGAGICMATFSAGLGGKIYNAEPQAIDYRASIPENVIVVPEDGYLFTGWSHGDYVSLRGNMVRGQKNIIHYDTLVIYGNIELTANFDLEKYPVHYHMNGGTNPENNPQVYTVKSGKLTLASPFKEGDVFIGWTGSNGEEPQTEVSIADGSTGTLEFYANYLYSGSEKNNVNTENEEDKIWSAKDELFIKTSKTGSILRIYSVEGTLQGQHIILSGGIAKFKPGKGTYIVTLNNGVGRIVIIN